MQDDRALVARADMLEVIRGELERSPQLASRNSRRAYLGALTAFENWRAGRMLSKLLVEQYAAELLAAGRARAGVNLALSAVRWWARRLADLAAEDRTLTTEQRREVIEQATRASTVEDLSGNSPKRGRHIADGEVRALLEACMADRGPAGARDAAAIAVAFATGMRRAELVGLQVGDVATIEDGYNLTIQHSKGNKEHSVAIYNGARDYLRDWLQVRGDRPGPLLVAIRKDGVLSVRGIGTQSLQDILAKRAAQAGVTNISWHDARRTLAGTLLDGGNDLSTVQKILGHSSPVTTAAYDRRPEETRRKALRGLHVPYLRGKR